MHTRSAHPRRGYPHRPESEQTYRPQRHRLQWANLLIVLFLGLVAIRLIDLQLISADYYRETISPQLLAQPRTSMAVPGALLARDGNELARSIYSFTLVANPDSITKNKVPFTIVARQLAPLIGRDEAELEQLLESRKNRKHVVVQQWLEADQVTAVREAGITGISLTSSYRRSYPWGTLACHLLGFRNQFHVPLSGLEHRYRLLLEGKPSAVASVTKNPSGTGLGQEGAFLPAVAGFDIMLTIDLPLQRYAEAAMDELWQRESPRNACAVVMDPSTGDILAMASRPSFNPDAIASACDSPDRQTPHFRQEHTRNIAVEKDYEPGSTIKVLLAAAALENGLDPSNTHHCSGNYQAGGQPINCWGRYRTEGHGTVDMQRMVSMSCNVTAAKIALELGPQRYLAFLHKAGLGQPPGAGFPAENCGMLVKREWLAKQPETASGQTAELLINPRAVSRRDVAVLGFGQGLSSSALQLTTAIGALANGGVRMSPRIIKQVLNKDGSVFRTPAQPPPVRVCSRQTAEAVLGMMVAAVEHGTGHMAAIEGVQVGAKTGTAQIWDPVARRFHADRHLASFVLICPADDPKFVIYVAADGARRGQHGSDVAGPTARDIAGFALRQVAVP